jgi:hypothetical protein
MISWLTSLNVATVLWASFSYSTIEYLYRNIYTLFYIIRIDADTPLCGCPAPWQPYNWQQQQWLHLARVLEQVRPPAALHVANQCATTPAEGHLLPSTPYRYCTVDCQIGSFRSHSSFWHGFWGKLGRLLPYMCPTNAPQLQLRVIFCLLLLIGTVL